MKDRIFDLSMNVINNIIDELKIADKFIRIAMFQIHNKEIFNILNEKIKKGVKIEVFTLPFDSINEDIRQEVQGYFENLANNQVKLYFCKWNVGDPGRTTTAVGRWYSFHGKFIVTDKSAIALSANFTQTPELDACLIFRNDEDKIDEYNKKFDELIDLFINRISTYDGSIRKRIIETGLPNIESVFKLPNNIPETHKDHWVQQYPSILCPIEVSIENKLYLTPFDCRGRNFLISIIDQAKDFVYISTESFTDIAFANSLIKTKLKEIDIRILTGATSQDFQDRLQDMFRKLLSQRIEMKTIASDLHAKLIITDKHLVISSINLNKINLGFNKTKQFWRENTESIMVSNDLTLIEQAKIRYLNIYNNSTDIEIRLAERIKDKLGKESKYFFRLNSNNEVKTLFARLIIRSEIIVKKAIFDIGKYTAKLTRIFNKNTIEKDEFISALVLYYLSERQLNREELKEKLDILKTNIDLTNLLSRLIDFNFIEKIDEFYKIKLDKLLNY